jgi:hypothetical protein
MSENVKGQNSDQQSSNTQSDIGQSNSDHQNTSSSRGGKTDMGSESLRGATGNSVRGNRGSGITTKRSVTGSDYDGQVSESNQ